MSPIAHDACFVLVGARNLTEVIAKLKEDRMAPVSTAHSSKP